MRRTHLSLSLNFSIPFHLLSHSKTLRLVWFEYAAKVASPPHLQMGRERREGRCSAEMQCSGGYLLEYAQELGQVCEGEW
jgi:hypothetical protein